MFFVCSGVKKNMALVLVVVVFGTTFGASPTKDWLEASHLLEGSQVDLATRNGSNANAENLKWESVDSVSSPCARSTGPPSSFSPSLSASSYRGIRDDFAANERNFTTGFYKGGYTLPATATDPLIGLNRGFYRLHPSNSTGLHPSNSTFSFSRAYLDRNVSVRRKILSTPNKTACQSYTFLKVLDNACCRGARFLLTSMRDFCLNIDKIVSGCHNYECDFHLPSLDMETWKVILEYQMRIRHNQFEKCKTFEINFSRPEVVTEIKEVPYYGILFDDWRRQMWGALDFSSYSLLVRIAVALFFVVVSNMGYLYLFERPERRCDIVVESVSKEEFWKNMLRKVAPDREITFSKKRHKLFYRVIATIKMKTGTIRYTSDSLDSYDRAYLFLALRWPKQRKDFQIQGILRAGFGIRETGAVKFLKATCFFAYFYWRSRTLTDRIVATTNWIDQLLDLGFARGIDVRLVDFYLMYKNLPIINQNKTGKDAAKRERLNVDIDFDADDNYGQDVKVEGLVECAGLLNSFLKGVFNSSSIRACFRLISLVWHMLFVFKDSKIDWEHLEKWDKAMFNSLPEKALTIGSTLLEQLSNLVTCSYEFYRTGDPSVFLRNDNEVSVFLESIEKISAEVKSLPVEPKLNNSIADLERRIYLLITQGENMRPKVKLTVRPAFTSGLLQLRSMALDVATMARASSTRAAPYTLLITGTPKIGKSSITQLIFRQFQVSNPYNAVLNNGLELHDGGIYTRTLKEEYWSCYMNSHWGILYDDIGQTNPKCPEFALEINEIIQVVNNIMFFPQMAIADDKGRRYVAPQIVLATSNNKDINAQHAVRSPGAVLRRFPFVVTPKLRPEFATDGTLDGKKATGHMDLWTFDIEEVVITNKGKDVTYRMIHTDLSTGSFLQWVDKSSTEHYQGQANSDEYAAKVSKSGICKGCRALNLFCKCLKPGAEVFTPSGDSSKKPGTYAKLDEVPDLVEDSDDEDSTPPPPRTFKAQDFDIEEEDDMPSRWNVERKRKDKKNRKEFRGKTARETKSSGSRSYDSSNAFGSSGNFDSSNQFASSLHPQSMSSSFKFYTSSGIILFAIMQTLLIGLFCKRLAGDPLKWFSRLFLQRGLVGAFGQSLALTISSDRSSLKALLFRYLNNFYHFDPIDSALLMWLNGWTRFASWCDQSYIKVKNAIHANPKIVAAIAVVLATSLFLYWYVDCTSGWNIAAKKADKPARKPTRWEQHIAAFQSGSDDDVDVHGIEIPDGVKPPEADANIENTWKSSQRLGMAAFMSDQSKTGNVEWFEQQLRFATATLEFSGCDNGIRGLNVFGNYWLLPKHYVFQEKFKKSRFVTVYRAETVAGMASYYGAFDMSTLICDPDSDFAIVRINTPPGVNLLPYLMKINAGDRLSAKVLFLRSDGAVAVPADPITVRKASFPHVSALNGSSLEHEYVSGDYFSSFQSVNGDCGSPMYIAEQGRLVICGVHVGSQQCDARHKYVMALPVAWIKKVYEGESSCVVQGVLDTEKLDGTKIGLSDDVHKKCPLRFEGLSDMPNGNSATPIGMFSGLALHKLSTRVQENIFAPFWRGVGYATNKVRPVLSSVKVPAWMPKRNFLLNACQHKDLIPYEILGICATHYLSRLTKLIPAKSIRKCVIIDEETNLYGAEGNNFISHMKFDTGAGFPHNQPKHKILDHIEHPRFPTGTCALPSKIRDKIKKMESIAAEGVRINVIFNSSLKDEPISQTKLEAGKIRVFQAICIEGLFLLRKYFLSLIALFQTWNFATEAAIGMDTTGPDWDDIHDHIFVDDSWKVFCGDYSNYDQRMGSSIMLKAWWIMIELARLSGNYPAVAFRIMWVLATECCFCMVNFFGDLICLNGSNPSGHGLTVIINSICNSLYIRVAWFEIFGNLDDFTDDYVRILTYGDDNIISVHPRFQEVFNQVTVTEALKKFGIVYTDAMKTGNEAKPFCKLDEISFLKRGFIWSKHGFWMAPLEVASIHKMLIIGVDEGKVQTKDRLSSVLISSVREAFHHGEEFYENHLELVRQCMNQYDLAEWVDSKGGLPTFQSLLEARLAKVSRASLLKGEDN